jgi:hypothetical protein
MSYGVNSSAVEVFLAAKVAPTSPLVDHCKKGPTFEKWSPLALPNEPVLTPAKESATISSDNSTHTHFFFL